MAYSTASLIALDAATTTASGLTASLAVYGPGILDAIVKEISSGAGNVTPQQQQRLAQLRAEIVANLAGLETALG